MPVPGAKLGVSASELKDLLAAGERILLDVRTMEERKESRIEPSEVIHFRNFKQARSWTVLKELHRSLFIALGGRDQFWR